MKSQIGISISVAAVIFFLCVTPACGQIYPSVMQEIAHDISPPLKNAAGASPLSCTSLATQLYPSPGTGLTVDQNFCGYATTPMPFQPPSPSASDTSGAVGPNNYFQTVNYFATIFDKKGTVVLGPFSTST
jgi:hypothetical protein